MSSVPGYKLPKHLAARRSAMRREWLVQVVAASLAVVAFVGAGLLIRPINRIRRERQLVIDPDSIKGLPPDLALLGKLGTFRALAIDWAAIRSERLKEEGKWYELLELHETVCALAPRFPSMWAYAGWNMAYNISVSQYSPEARWLWVQNGIRILRDKGIQYNPKSVTLYKELAWIYWHKIGDFLDDEHMNYKRALAVEMERVLGAPPVTLTDREYFDWFRKIVDAPRDLDEFLDSDPEAARLASRLDGVALKLDVSLLDFVARHVRPELRTSELLKNDPDADPLTARRTKLVRDPKLEEPLERLLAVVRSNVLRSRYRFDLDAMLELMDQYGPLDWRNAFSHALYWADRGDRASRGHENININDQMNNARFVFLALQNLTLKGRITLRPDFDDPFSSYIELTPDTRYIPYLYEAYMRLGKEHFGDDPRYKEGTPGPVYLRGFITNMRDWVQLLYLEGGEKNVELAANFYAWLRENNPHPDGSTQERYLVTLEEFVMGDILNQLKTYKAAGAFIRSFIQRALKQFALGMSGAGVNSLQRAKASYDYWMEDAKRDINERRQMQPFGVVVRDEIESYMKHPRIGPLYKAALWKHLPLRQRQMAYDHLRPYFDRLCEFQQPPWNVLLAFTQPPGMGEFRKQAIEYSGPARRKDVEEGTRYKP
jgi:hypothetical protein